jgi:hypothetical protein
MQKIGPDAVRSDIWALFKDAGAIAELRPNAWTGTVLADDGQTRSIFDRDIQMR